VSVTSASNGGLTSAIDRQVGERQREVARQAGRDGLDRAKVTRGRADLQQAYDEGAEERGRIGADGLPAEGSGVRQAFQDVNASGPGWGSLRPTSPARVPTRAADAGGFLSGLALYAVVMIYIRYGPAGWKGWLSAKFLNKPLTGANGASGPTTKSGGKAAV
jgi:hypothetical protein